MSKTRTFTMVLVIATAFLAIAGARASAAGQAPARCASIPAQSGTAAFASCGGNPVARPGARFYPYMQK